MFERYTEPARRVIFYARAEALRRGAPQITTADIFVALTREHRDPGTPFSFLHDREQEYRELFGFGPSNFNSPEEKDIPLTDNSKRALAYAAEEVQRDGGYSLQSYHLLRGLLRVGDETTTKLNAAGIDLESMRMTSQGAPRRRAPGGSASLRSWKVFRRSVLGAAILLLAAAILYLRSQN